MKRQIGLKEGFPIAMGSIIGSGILFLPSLTYKVSGPSVFYVWLLATLACIPLIPIFQDMAEKVDNSSGIKGYIALALGEKIGKIIPILFLSTVCLGMPSAAFIAMQYLGEYFGLGASTQKLLALILIETCVLVVVFGIKLSARVQFLVTIGLIGLSVFFMFTLGGELVDKINIPTSVDNYGLLFKGITVAFWAYAGFENLSFLAAEFRNPKKDLRLSICLALVVCGLIYFFLSMAYASFAPGINSSNLASLYDLAQFVPYSSYFKVGVVIFAVSAVTLNLLSWTGGISRMIYDAANSNILPKQLGALNAQGEPQRAILFLGFLFLLANLVLILLPGIFENILVAVSANFVFIYVLAVFSFLKLNRKNKKLTWYMASLLLIFFAVAFLSSGESIFYTLTIFILTFLSFYLLARRPNERKSL